MLHLPRIMLAAPASGSGKTMLVCGLLQAFVNRGLHPASFKCGPDYIDPMFHAKVIGTESRNLDTFFTEEQITRYLFARTASGAGISVLEGVMGIYDGLGGRSVRASSYELASVTETPVILVVNARGMSLSVIPLIQGYLGYQEQLGKRLIRGVILNRMTRMTYLRLADLIEEQTGIRVFGYVPELEDCRIESRHLGLVMPDEILDLRKRLERLSDALEQSLDLDGILALAQDAGDYEEDESGLPECAAGLLRQRTEKVETAGAAGSGEGTETEKTKTVPAAAVSAKSGKGAETEKAKAENTEAGIRRPRIAVAWDEAFCFYYQDNLDLLEQLGAELVTFSPLREESLPADADALLLGGGYPELYARRLSENTKMITAIRQALRAGMPYLAECGGFMYLHDTMEDMEGKSWPMCGVIAGNAFRTPKLSRFGYITLSSKHEGAGFLPEGQTIRAHEFHYFDSDAPGADYLAQKPGGGRQWDCIHADDHSMAGYPHLYYWSNPQFAEAFVNCARKYRKYRKGRQQALAHSRDMFCEEIL